jgi:hypothetical protein
VSSVARIADKVCFTGIVYRLALGCSWVDAGRLVGVGQATLRRRRDEWIAAGIFDALIEQAIAGYDRIRGLDLSEVSIDGSLHKAPCAGEATGPNPTDRAKKGWKWSLACDAAGIPIGWAIDGANRHDLRLLAPTLDAVTARGLDLDIDTLHLDRGYDTNTVRDELAARHLHDAVIAANAVAASPSTRPHSRYGWGCAGRWNGPTRGCPTTASSAATPTASPATASPNSRSPSP